jgi:hypothetical protein
MMRAAVDEDLVAVQAVHEASHVVTAHAVGLPVDSVQLGPNPRFNFVDTPTPEQRVAHILTLMAGCEGKSALLNREPTRGGTDDPRIAELLDGEDEAVLRRQVRSFLAANYPTVLRVANALKRNGVLTGDEVKRLVRKVT